MNVPTFSCHKQAKDGDAKIMVISTQKSEFSNFWHLSPTPFVVLRSEF